MKKHFKYSDPEGKSFKIFWNLQTIQEAKMIGKYFKKYSEPEEKPLKIFWLFKNHWKAEANENIP